MFNIMAIIIYYRVYPRLFLLIDPGVCHSSNDDKLSGCLLLFLSNSQQSAVACEKRGQTAHLGRLFVLLLVAAVVSGLVSLMLVLRLPVLLWLPRYLPQWPFPAPALVGPPVLILLPILLMSWPFCFSSSSICISSLAICDFCFLTNFNRSSFCVVISWMCSLSAVAATATSMRLLLGGARLCLLPRWRHCKTHTYGECCLGIASFRSTCP